MKWLSLRSNRLKTKTLGKLPKFGFSGILENMPEIVRGKKNERFQHVTCQAWKQLARISTVYVQKSPGHWEYQLDDDVLSSRAEDKFHVHAYIYIVLSDVWDCHLALDTKR